MCGICGVLEDGGLSPLAKGGSRRWPGARLTAAPDDEGFFTDRFAALDPAGSASST